MDNDPLSNMWNNGPTQYDALRRNRGYWAYAATAFAAALAVARKAYVNLKDGNPFLDSTKIAKQVITQALDSSQWRALIDDATHDIAIPEAGPESNVLVSKNVANTWKRMSPMYLRPAQSLSLLQRASLRWKFANVSTWDYPADENSVPTLLTIGLLARQAGYHRSAHKYLGMANNWADKARELGVDATKYHVVLEYQKHLDTSGQPSLEYLLHAWQISGYAATPASESAGRTYGDLSEKLLIDPMNYAVRTYVVRNQRALREAKRYKPRDIETIAERSYDEIQTILRQNRAGASQEQLQQYSEEFARFLRRPQPPRAPTAQQGGRPQQPMQRSVMPATTMTDEELKNFIRGW